MNKHLKCFLVLVATPVFLPIFSVSMVLSAILTAPSFLLQATGCIELLPMNFVMDFWGNLFDKVRDF